jgi:hypothetical protein
MPHALLFNLCEQCGIRAAPSEARHSAFFTAKPQDKTAQ